MQGACWGTWRGAEEGDEARVDPVEVTVALLLHPARQSPLRSRCTRPVSRRCAPGAGVTVVTVVTADGAARSTGSMWAAMAEGEGFIYGAVIKVKIKAN